MVAIRNSHLRSRIRSMHRFRSMRHQAGRRVDGTLLQPSLRHSDDGSALFYRLWTMGRPDSRVHSQSHSRRSSIDVFNNGEMKRDHKVSDIVPGVLACLDDRRKAARCPAQTLQSGQQYAGTADAFIEVIELSSNHKLRSISNHCSRATLKRPTQISRRVSVTSVSHPNQYR